MGELTRPIMTPLGVIYRSYCDTEGEALKYAQWAVKLFGGTATAFNLVCGKKGYYEAVILATVPANAKCFKERKKPEPTDWFQTPEPAYVLFDSLETPIALYFHKRELMLKPTTTPPMTAYHILDLEQT